MRSTLLLLLLPLLPLAACGGDEEELSACESAMKAASEVSDMEDTVSDLDPAIAACATLAEFEAASEKYPAALDGAPVEAYVSNRCADTATGAICDEVGG